MNNAYPITLVSAHTMRTLSRMVSMQNGRHRPGTQQWLPFRWAIAIGRSCNVAWQYVKAKAERLEQALLISIAALLLYMLLWGTASVIALVAHVEFLRPEVNLDENMDVGDLFFSYGHLQATYVSDDIVIIDAGGTDRRRKAEILEAVIESDPITVGFDFALAPGDGGDLESTHRLKALMKANRNIVCAYPLDETREGREPALGHLVDVGDPDRFGFWKLSDNPKKSTLRKALVWAPGQHGDTLFGFAAQLFRQIRPTDFSRITSGASEQTINYMHTLDGEFFETISADSFMSLSKVQRQSLCSTRVVLLGTMERNEGKYHPARSNPSAQLIPNSDDRHYTPLNPRLTGRSEPDMAGVVIHGQILAMMMQDRYVTELGVAENLMVAFPGCFVVSLLLTFVHRRSVLVYTLLKVPIFIAASMLLFSMAILAFKHNVMLSMLTVLLPVWLCGEARELVEDLHQRNKWIP